MRTLKDNRPIGYEEKLNQLLDCSDASGAYDAVHSLLNDSPVFSKASFRALNDIYNLNFNFQIDNPSIHKLFDARWIRQVNMEDIATDPVDDFHVALREYLLTLDFQPDGFGDIDGTQRLRIRGPIPSGENPTMPQLEAAVEHVGRKYIEFLRLSGYPDSLIKDDFQLTNFVMATKDGGYHFPHMHNNAMFVVAYYVYVPNSSDGKIVFGLNRRHGVPRLHAPDFAVKQPRTGDFIIFPGFYSHSTTASTSSETRINIAFDFNPVNEI